MLVWMSWKFQTEVGYRQTVTKRRQIVTISCKKQSVPVRRKVVSRSCLSTCQLHKEQNIIKSGLVSRCSGQVDVRTKLSYLVSNINIETFENVITLSTLELSKKLRLFS